MLVLTRKAKQQIQIGPHITITILQIKGQQVRVGIEAPKDVCVLRTELATKLTQDDSAPLAVDPTVVAALEKFEREAEITSAQASEPVGGRTKLSHTGSVRYRAPRENAPLTSPFQPSSSAALLRPRRRRVSIR